MVVWFGKARAVVRTVLLALQGRLCGPWIDQPNRRDVPFEFWCLWIVPIPEGQDFVVAGDHDGLPPTLTWSFVGENHVTDCNRLPVLRQPRSQRWQNRWGSGWRVYRVAAFFRRRKRGFDLLSPRPV